MAVRLTLHVRGRADVGWDKAPHSVIKPSPEGEGIEEVA
jgi:hypothetical protein